VDAGRPGERYLLGGTEESYLEMVRIIGELTGKKVPSAPMPAWVLRVYGQLSEWGSLVTGRRPTVTPEIVAGTSRAPQLFRSDKAMRELGYRAVPLRDMLRDAYEWLKAEKLVR
jgi:nucleoside-diphosphate-sugar epimerase